MATEEVLRAHGAGARAPRARQRARERPRASRVSLHRHARRRQDHHRAHPRQMPQLRDRCAGGAVRRLCELPRDRRRTLPGPHRGRCGLAHEGRRHPRAPRQRAVRPDARPLQGVPRRRGAHAVRALLQRAAEDPRGAAAAREVPPGDHRPAEAARHGAVALPAVQPQAAAGRGHRRAAEAHSRRGGGGVRRRGIEARGAGGRRQHARCALAARSADCLRRRSGGRSRGTRHAGHDFPRPRAAHRAAARRGGRGSARLLRPVARGVRARLRAGAR